MGERAICMESRHSSRWLVSIQVAGRLFPVELESDHLVALSPNENVSDLRGRGDARGGGA
jgi:hypothetical protein